MAKFVKVDSTIEYDSPETQEVYVNIDLVTSIKKSEDVYIIELINKDSVHTKSLPNGVLEPNE